jgi:hypothetical protein
MLPLMSHRLPTEQEALRILAAKRTRRMPRASPPAGRSLAPLIKALDDRFGRGPDVLRARWREIVGEALATRTEPVKLSKPRGGGGAVLELKVDGPAAALIQHQAPDILARVNLFLGAGSVARLRVVQGPLRRAAPDQTAARTAQSRRRRARPLDAALEAELEAGLARFAEGPLKAALRHLGREVLRQGRREGED